MIRSAAVLCLSLLVPIASGQVVPMTNDECFSAIPVGDGTNPGAPSGTSGHVFTNAGSTQSPSFICISGVSFDVWFVYFAAGTGTLTVTTCPPPGFAPGSLDTVLTIFDGSPCPPLFILNCDDDTCGVWSTASTSVTAGAIYYIRVSGLFGSTGTFYLNVAGPAATVSNDECTSPIALSVGPNGPYSNSLATSSPGVAASCGSAMSPGFRDLWFSHTPTCPGILTVDTGCNGFDTILTAYAACGGPEIACNDDATGCGASSSISFFAMGGVTYRIRAAARSAVSTGTFSVNVSVGGLTLGFTSPFGPGSIQVNVTGGPPLGTYFLPLTFFPGAFPNGWLYGLDLPFAELQALLGLGAPFVGPLGGCGDLVIGPFGGLFFLSGVPIYGVVLGIPQGSPVPTVHSAAVTYTIP